MTYKKAARLISKLLKERGIHISRSAEKQAGYLVLWGTEGETSKDMHHDLKQIVKNLPCACQAGSMDDDVMMERIHAYADGLSMDDFPIGELDHAWLVVRAKTREFWRFFKL